MSVGIPNLYNRDHADSGLQTQQYGHNLFEQGRRPHYYIDDSYVAQGIVFDTLVMVNESEVTYTNELGGDGATAVTFPVGDRIYGLFDDANITVAAGGLVRAYASYPQNTAK